MSRELRDQLAETLRERAASVPEVPTLAGAALARGRALRRRRRIAATLAPAVAAVVVVVTAVTALTGTGDRADRPPRPAATTESRLAPPPPYVSVPGQGATVRSVIHVGQWSVPLPVGTSVLRLFRAGPGVVAEVRDRRGESVVYVGPDGRPRTLPDLQPPVAVNADGTLVAARLPNGYGGPAMVLAQLPGGERLYLVPGEYDPLSFVDEPHTTVLFASYGGLGIWQPAQYGLHDAKGVRYTDGAVLSGAPDGRLVLVAEPGELRAVDLGGRTHWTRLGDYRDGTAFAWSADGALVAIADGRHVDVVTGTDGRLVRRTRELPFDVAGVTWQDATQVIALERDQDGYRQRETCDVRTGACEPYRRLPAILPER